jgi:2-oxoglutarate dehydrogenase E2 component (dihydrolipoamide succinyltransferase)
MPTAVIMPELGESVDEATITQWLKQEGDSIREFEPLLEVNTDKVDTEIPSPATGTILKILASPEQVVQAGMTLAWIGVAGEEAPGDAPAPAKPDPAPQAAAFQGETPGPAADSPLSGARSPATGAVKGQTIPLARRPGRDPQLGFISPVVARMASENNLDLGAVTGTGKDGRITKLDVQAYLDSGAPPAKPPRVPAPRAQPAEAPGEIVKHTTMRKAIADHMVMSKRTSPHVTTVMEADMSRVAAHRAAHKAQFARDSANLTYTAYFIAAIAAALKQHPLVNSSWSDAGVRLHRDINIGMATALETDGLIVPVIKAADGLSLLGIARAVNDLASRARSKQLTPDEVRGGTFTLTNHGTSGSLFATPIINQPQCGILGVGMLQKRAVVISGETGDSIAIRPMVYISLTFDHRILDGASADYFLAAVKGVLEGWA